VLNVGRAKPLASEFATDLRYFGWGPAIARLRLGLPRRLRTHPRFEGSWHRKRHNAVRQYLVPRFGDVAARWRDRPLPQVSDPDAKVWTCWWQGEEQAPPVVRECLASIRRNASKQVICITEENCSEYIDIPEHLIRRVSNGSMSFTHLSDYIRFSLLYKYGGLWLDATIWCGRPIPDEVFDRRLFTCKRVAEDHQYVSQYRWTSFALAGWPGHPFFGLLADLTASYWERNTRLIDYLLIDYFIEMSYESVAKGDIDAVPLNNPHTEHMPLSDEFQDDVLCRLVASTWMFKLTYKRQYNERIGDRATFFGAIVSGK